MPLRAEKSFSTAEALAAERDDFPIRQLVGSIIAISLLVV